MHRAIQTELSIWQAESSPNGMTEGRMSKAYRELYLSPLLLFISIFPPPLNFHSDYGFNSVPTGSRTVNPPDVRSSATGVHNRKNRSAILLMHKSFQDFCGVPTVTVQEDFEQNKQHSNRKLDNNR